MGGRFPQSDRGVCFTPKKAIGALAPMAFATSKDACARRTRRLALITAAVLLYKDLQPAHCSEHGYAIRSAI